MSAPIVTMSNDPQIVSVNEEDIPERMPGRKSGRTASIRKELRARPGTWAIVAKGEAVSEGADLRSLAQSLRGGKTGADIESITRTVDSEVLVYARATA